MNNRDSYRPIAIASKTIAISDALTYCYTTRDGQLLSQRASYDQTWQRCTKKCYIPIIKVPCLPVSERNFEVGLLCS